MSNLNDFMQEFCSFGAKAVARYSQVAGEDVTRMPEYFMPAYILDQMGNKFSASLETSFRTLIHYNNDARKRLSLPPVPHNEDLLLLAEQLGKRRVDMVVYEGERDGVPKDQQPFLALIEFKSGYLDGLPSDRDKLLMLLEHVDTCQWGIMCGWANGIYRDWHKESMKGTRDSWCEMSIPSRPNLFFCARVLERGSDPERLRNLLQGFAQVRTSAS